MMIRERLVSHLHLKREEKQEHLNAASYIEKLKTHLPKSVFDHVWAVISSKVAACDISIRDHEKELNAIDQP